MAIQINLGERLIRLADKVLSKNSNETIGHTGGITNATANDTYIPTTKAVKEYVDDKFNGHTHPASEVTIIDPNIEADFVTHDASYDTDITNRLISGYGISPSADLNNYATYVNATLNSKAPYSHSINDGRHGIASSTNYGHIRVMNNLTSTGTTDALSAKQGKELKTLIDTKVPIADIQDNLTSTDTNKPLSANQGRILKSSVDTKANQNHTHANISDSGWQNVIFESGFQNYDTNHPVRYRRIGKIVHLEGIIKNTNAFTPGTTEKKVAFIDDIYCRPNYPQTALMQGSDGNKFLLTINPTGDIDVSRYGTTTPTTEVTAGRWLNCYATWITDTEQISIPTLITEYSRSINNDNFYYTIELKNANNNRGIDDKEVKFYIDNQLQSTNNTDNGLIEFAIPYSTWSNKGNHTLRFLCEEGGGYRTSTMSSTLSYNDVTKPTHVNIEDGTTIDEGSTFKITWPITYLSDNDNTPISNCTVKYYLNNTLKSTYTTNSNGQCTVVMNIPKSSPQTYKIVFNEKLPYREHILTNTFNFNNGSGPIISN